MRGPRRLELKTPEPPAVTGKPIKTLIVTDYVGSMGDTPEEEAAYIARLFRENYGLELDYAHFTAVPAELDDYKLIIIDYGGVMPGAHDNQITQIQAICDWAEMHPTRLALIWTSFTSRVWKWELEEDYKDVANVLHWQPVDESGHRKMLIDEETAHQDKVAYTIKALFGGTG